MNRYLRHSRWAWPATGLAGLVLVLVMLVAPPGWSRSPAPVWNDQAVSVTPLTTPGPNWVELAKAVKPAVVNVTGRQDGGRSAGSGFVINGEGYIVTNNHVVENANTIVVKLSDGRRFADRLGGLQPSSQPAADHRYGGGEPRQAEIVDQGNVRAEFFGEQIGGDQ